MCPEWPSAPAPPPLTPLAESDFDRFARALWIGRVTFSDVAGAWLHMSNPTADLFERKLFGRLYPLLLEAFASVHGGMVRCAFFPDVRAALALTGPGGIRAVADDSFDPGDQVRIAVEALASIAPWWTKPPVPPRAARAQIGESPAIQLVLGDGSPIDAGARRLLLRADALQQQARRHLSRSDRAAALLRIYGLMASVLSLVRLERGDRTASDTDPDGLRAVQRELEESERWLADLVQLEAQTVYLNGMLLGAVSIGIALGAVIVAVGGTARELATPAAGGALGAIVSVLSRLTSAGLGLRSDAPRRTLRVFGALRPGAGASLGAVVWVLAAVIFGSSIDSGSPRDLALLALAGFLVGFGERFVQDVLVTTPKAGVTDDAAALVARAAGRAAQSGWRRAPREQVAEFLRQTVKSSIDEVVAGPALVNWSGYVRAQFDGADGDRADEEVDEDGGPRTALDHGGRSVLRVVFSSRRTNAPFERPIDIADGVAADAAPFQLVPTSDQLEFEARATDAKVTQTGETTVTLPFTAPEVPGSHRAWVQIRQRNRTVQVVEATVLVKPKIGADE